MILLFCLFRAHWYLVVICFPGLEEPKIEAWTGLLSWTGEVQDQDEAHGSKSPNVIAETRLTLNHSDSVDTETGGFG